MRKSHAHRTLLTGLFALLLAFAVIGTAAAEEVLNVWVPGLGNNEEVWKSINTEFEKANPGVKVEMRLLPDNLEQSYLVAHAAGVGPDVAYMWNEMMPGFVAKDIILPIDRFVTAEDKENYYNIDYTLFQGKRWGVPLFAGARVLYYNNQHFQEAGMTPPNNWDEFRSAAKKLTKDDSGDGNPDRWGFRLGYHTERYGRLNDSWDPWFLQAGGSWFSEDGRQLQIDTQPAKDALQFLHSLVYEDESAFNGGTEGFSNGSLSMYYSGISVGQRLLEQQPNFDLGVKVALKNKAQKTWFATDYLVMFNTGKNPETAWKWMKFATSGPMMRRIHSEIMQLPIARDEGNPFPDDLVFQALFPNMEMLQARAIVPNGSKVYQAVYDNLRKAMLNEMPIPQALEEGQRLGQTLLTQGWEEMNQ